MTNMFPSMYRGRTDKHDDLPTKFDAEPKSLTVGYWWLLVFASFMIFFGLVVATSGYSGDPNVDPRLMAAVERNQRFIGIYNIVAGFVLAMLLTQVRKAVKYSRRWVVAIVFFTAIADLIAFTVKSAGLGIALVPMGLTIGALIIYRPIVNRYFALMNDEVAYD